LSWGRSEGTRKGSLSSFGRRIYLHVTLVLSR
jgi:hypothetical protein